MHLNKRSLTFDARHILCCDNSLHTTLNQQQQTAEQTCVVQHPYFVSNAVADYAKGNNRKYIYCAKNTQRQAVGYIP